MTQDDQDDRDRDAERAEMYRHWLELAIQQNRVPFPDQRPESEMSD